ncbi:YlxQ family RNA-binding protein [Fictibacillus sp. WQ 8-8]|nr:MULTISPECIES: YlxQ family RNA-binding protein [unclassified Fictibacillus]MCQ6265833.1 YlxQ family RNA-binding protein [Fictibacillus sp. WQ 8-8]MED2973285.1 YlxQ family RNA-binding protein [Fictibacillus sp. B-59209]UZJ81117.1 YlxQ family RNA-binding protein [Fictibacillus sp. KU28468]
MCFQNSKKESSNLTASKWASLLGLANRAGKCISGEELVVKAVQRQNAKLVILSQDASANTRKKVTDKCAYYKVEVRWVDDRYSLGSAIGKDQRVVVAVTDVGFTKKLTALLD